MDRGETSRAKRTVRKHIMGQRRELHGCDLGSQSSSSLTPLAKKQRITTGLSNSNSAEIRSSSTGDTNNLNIAPHNLGLPAYNCQYCGAIFWFDERIKALSSRVPVFSLCCRQGRIKLTALREPSDFLARLLDYNGGNSLKQFWDNIRLYNSMFSFTSIGGKIDKEINRRQGPYIFKLNGQNHHLIGSLLPMDEDRPQFAQLYVYDTENETSNRISAVTGAAVNNQVDENIVSQLVEMFDEVNVLVKTFRMARDRFRDGETRQVCLTLSSKCGGDGIQYSAPSVPEMAGLVVGDIGITDYGRDIVVDHRSQGLRRIDDLHPALMAMQYLLLFPYGEDGYRLNIICNKCRENRRLKGPMSVDGSFIVTCCNKEPVAAKC